MAAPVAKLGLPRQRLLKQGRDFTRLRTAGRRLVSGCLIVNWLPVQAGSANRVGFVTSRKLGGAVVRNRSRRLMREAYRLHQKEFLHAVDLVLIARPSLAGKSFTEVERDYLNALRQARLKKEPA